MIENDDQLKATHEALGHLYRAVASLRQTMLPVKPRQYALFAEGPLDEIRKLQAEIDAYLGLAEKEELHADAINEPQGPYRASEQ